MDEKIKKLWETMENELRQKDEHGDWPCKSIVMRSPWNLEVHCYCEAFEDHETQLDFVRMDAVRPEDFDESSLPADLLAIVKEDSCGDRFYPNAVYASVSGDTLEEAIEKMRQKLRLLDYGYILMDEAFYNEEILDEDNGAWMLDDDYDFDFDFDDDDEDDDDED